MKLCKLLLALLACLICSGRAARHAKLMKMQATSLFALSHSSSVPRIIHQSWKNSDVPEQYKNWQKSWVEMHPHWQYNLWTDQMNHALVENHFRWFLPIYNRFPAEIFRADAARYMYMYKYGGVYADLDFRALKAMDGLLVGSDPQAYVGRLSDDMEWNQNLPNAWLASSPGHPFWMFCLMEIARASGLIACEGVQCTGGFLVERSTGPWMLWRSVHRFSRNSREGGGQLTILQPEMVYPLNWRPHHFDKRCIDVKEESDCTKHFPDSYAITFWSHSWGR